MSNFKKMTGFYPYLSMVFLNAFVDIGHKILIQDTLYQTASGAAYTILAAIINALILLPYVFLFTPAGFLADKFAKVKVLRFTALAAIPLIFLVMISYSRGSFWAAFSLTLLLAMQSAINSPAKYGYIKEIFGKQAIAPANAMLQVLTIFAILSATFIFTLLFEHYLTLNHLLHSQNAALLLKSFAPAGWILLTCATLEALMTLFLPKKPAADPTSDYKIKKFLRAQYLKPYLQTIRYKPVIFICVIGLALFWAINQVLLASYGAYLKEHVGAVSALFAQGSLAVGGIGVLCGAYYAGRISKGFIEVGIIPAAALGMTMGLFLLPATTHAFLIVLLFLVYGFFGGMLLVPLNSLIQLHAREKEIGKVLSANNFMQNIFMIGFLGLTILFSLLGVNTSIILYGLFFIALSGSVYAVIKLPRAMLRYLIYFVINKFYKISVLNNDNIPAQDGVLLLGNHVSFIDWALLQIACPRPIRFVMDSTIYKKWYLHWLLKHFDIFPISRGASKETLAEISNALQQGDIVALFPEGRLSRNGQLGTFQSGFERLTQSNHQIVPFYLHGVWGSRLSYANQAYKKISHHRKRHLIITFGKPLPMTSTAAEVKRKIQLLSVHSWQHESESQKSLPITWLRRAKKMGNKLCLIDSIGQKFTNYQLIATVMYFTQQLKKYFKKSNTVGILLPPSAASSIANLTVLCCGKTVVNLNYTSTEAILSHTLQTANIKNILTSRAFLTKLTNLGFNSENALRKINIIYLEDYKKPLAKLTIGRNLIIAKCLPTWILRFLFIKPVDANTTAHILFSSGSEGKPKGIELTHHNLLANIKQVSSVFNIKNDDRVLSILPLFHAFGLTVTTLMPLIEGIPLICYPDPTNAAAVGQMIFRHQATVLCGSSTFFGIYLRNPKVYSAMFQTLRLVIAGAEKLSDTIRDGFKQKFNLDVYEGYGATEVAPVASCNLPPVLSPDMHLQIANQIGSVGLPLPGSAFRIVDPESLADLPLGAEGLILIAGPQVMRGYLNNPEKTNAAIIKAEGLRWYVTGDKGRLDETGYLTIVDRYSRFAKIGGEMVSLGMIEKIAEEIIVAPDAEFAAIALPDVERGEKIYLLYTATLENNEMQRRLRESHMNKLMLPNKVFHVDTLPKLGSGKKDYVTAKKIVLSLLASDTEKSDLNIKITAEAT